MSANENRLTAAHATVSDPRENSVLFGPTPKGRGVPSSLNAHLGCAVTINTMNNVKNATL